MFECACCAQEKRKHEEFQAKARAAALGFPVVVPCICGILYVANPEAPPAKTSSEEACPPLSRRARERRLIRPRPRPCPLGCCAEQLFITDEVDQRKTLTAEALEQRQVAPALRFSLPGGAPPATERAN